VAGFAVLEVTVEEAASLVHVQPATIRRRLRAGELRVGRRGDGVVLDPAETWLRVEDAGTMLGVTSATVRAAIGRGELAGRRERGGRWRVRLESVLADRRCDPDVVARFGGEPPAPAPRGDREVPPARLRRDLFLRLDAEDVELLERARDRHGTYREAVSFALRVADEEATSPAEVAELRADRDLFRDETAAARERARELAALARTRVVDELYCPACEGMVPIEEAEYAEVDDGRVAIYHGQHGYRRGGRLRASSVMAHRRSIEDEE
jgi:hypothetical protein